MNIATAESPVKSAKKLREELLDFVYDAEGEMAIALESHAANYGGKNYDRQRQDLLIDTFIFEGQVGESTPLDLFLQEQENISQNDRQMLQGWKHSFLGLFEVIKIAGDRATLMNWFTQKKYPILFDQLSNHSQYSRLKSGEIIHARLAPLTENEWILFGSFLMKGKLSKPKLAVAIGEFRERHQNSLYGDAPELLEEAWESVEKYHREFVDFFGENTVTLPGYQLNQKIGELCDRINQKRFAELGIDRNKSLKEIAEEAGADEAEIREAALEAGADEKELDAVLGSSDSSSKMVTPKAELPPEIKNAEWVTVFTHPRWGQMFLPTYRRFAEVLESDTPEDRELTEAFVHKYLDDPQVNAYIWHHLGDAHPHRLEQALKKVLERPDFSLQTDLDPVLAEYGKSLEPDLPDIASVPRHLDDLFKEAIAQVNPSKSKRKKKSKKSKGFQL
ncbi:MAG: hypothetical protein ACP5D7_18600 [Limnospira sp.]